MRQRRCLQVSSRALFQDSTTCLGKSLGAVLKGSLATLSHFTVSWNGVHRMWGHSVRISWRENGLCTARHSNRNNGAVSLLVLLLSVVMMLEHRASCIPSLSPTAEIIVPAPVIIFNARRVIISNV